MTKEYAVKRLKSIDIAVMKLFDNYLEMLDKNSNDPQTIEDYTYLFEILNEEIKKIIERIKAYDSEREMLIQIINSDK